MTIQYAMLVLLGFLIACFLALLTAPAFWSRAVRLTSQRLRQSLPMTQTEIDADKDRLRAQYAMRVHLLEKQVEQASLGGARQKIDLNRRDANIAALEQEIGTLQSRYEEAQNALRVLEQTVTDRLPRVEGRLEEARKLLISRDRDVATLSQSTRQQKDALSEARAISQRQANEIERLKTQLLAYEAQNRRGPRDADFEGELAIRAELESLRARVRDQSSLIDRLNAEVSSARQNSAAFRVPATNGGAAPDIAALLASQTDQDVMIEQLRRELAEAQGALQRTNGVIGGAGLPGSTDRSLDKELQALRARNEDQSGEIARLKGELASVTAAGQGDARGAPTLRDNRVALKARVTGLEAKITQQSETIGRLRAEMAAANERAARQAAQFMSEMRNLGLAAHVNASRTGRPQGGKRDVSRRTAAVLDSSGSGRGLGAKTGVGSGTPAVGTPANAQSMKLADRVSAAAKPTATSPALSNARVSNLVGILRGEITSSPPPPLSPAAGSSRLRGEKSGGGAAGQEGAPKREAMAGTNANGDAAAAAPDGKRRLRDRLSVFTDET